jgi:hypothetical protein
MGTWGFGILDDDQARDVYDRYVDADASGAHADADAIVRTLRASFADLIDDPDEGPVFWLAIAQAQWERSGVTPEVRKHVDDIVARGLGLARWAEAGAGELARRKAALTRFAARLGKPRTGAARPSRPDAGVPFVVGDCLAIDLGDGRFGAAVVTKSSSGTTPSHIISIVDFYGTAPPDAAMFDPPPWLQVPGSPGTIVKYSVYATGYRRHGRKYRVVCRIMPGAVPPPLTLGLANWSSVWADLAGRLRERPVRWP